MTRPAKSTQPASERDVCSYFSFLSSNVVRRIFINADELDHFLVQQDALLNGNGPRLRVRFGIVDRDFDLEVPEVWPAESFGHFRSISQGIADDIQPTLVDETT